MEDFVKVSEYDKTKAYILPSSCFEYYEFWEDEELVEPPKSDYTTQYIEKFKHIWDRLKNISWYSFIFILSSILIFSYFTSQKQNNKESYASQIDTQKKLL